MTAARLELATLVERLPQVRGRYETDVVLGSTAWLRVGGPADVVFWPAGVEDLAAFLAMRPAGVALTVLGALSNVLIRDGGVRGVVIRLGRPFAEIAFEGSTVMAGAGAMDVNVALKARDAGVAGLEFLRGIPGTIGGALRMNAGAFGREIADVLEWAEALDAKGQVHRLRAGDIGFSYRRCDVPEGWIFTRAWLKGEPGRPVDIARRLNEISRLREATQPVKSRTGGSTFLNPQGANAEASAKAWELIERAGCRGLRRGGAIVSEQHCNFLINTGQAAAADFEALGEEIRRRVRERTGVDLQWELRLLGEPGPASARTKP
jgi:UDP-N-acetylmuramate dehydrogenase